MALEVAAAVAAVAGAAVDRWRLRRCRCPLVGAKVVATLMRYLAGVVLPGSSSGTIMAMTRARSVSLRSDDFAQFLVMLGRYWVD